MNIHDTLQDAGFNTAADAIVAKYGADSLLAWLFEKHPPSLEDAMLRVICMSEQSKAEAYSPILSVIEDYYGEILHQFIDEKKFPEATSSLEQAYAKIKEVIALAKEVEKYPGATSSAA